MKCINCDAELSKKHQKKFCSRKCSAIFNNTKRAIPNVCLTCSAIIKRKPHKFCSHKCVQKFKHKQKIREFLNGNVSGCIGNTASIAVWLRRYLKDLRGSGCEICGWDEKHPSDGLSLTEINHIDGNAKNNNLKNLQVVCPNCHSKTVNFRARNKKSSRVR